MFRIWRSLAALAIVVMFSGCASYERDWRNAMQQPPAKPGTIAGPWKGNWLSDHDGHHGELRCLVTAVEPDLYEFRFKATYWKLFRFSYSVNMPVECSSEGCKFHGEADLGGLAGGIYHYDGTLTGTNLHSTFKCKYDYGTFDLTRPR